eukprot:4599791-Alexandrium_andersonii.AAC.1
MLYCVLSSVRACFRACCCYVVTYTAVVHPTRCTRPCSSSVVQALAPHHLVILGFLCVRFGAALALGSEGVVFHLLLFDWVCFALGYMSKSVVPLSCSSHISKNRGAWVLNMSLALK